MANKGPLKAVPSPHNLEWSYWIEDKDGNTVAAVTRAGRPLAHTLATSTELLSALIGVTNELHTLRADFEQEHCLCRPEISHVCVACRANVAIDKAELEI